MMRIVASLIVHARARQAAARRDEAVDAPPRPFAPADVERRELRKELQLAVGEMVVDPPGHRPPICAVRVPVRVPSCTLGHLRAKLLSAAWFCCQPREPRRPKGRPTSPHGRFRAKIEQILTWN